MTIRWRLEQILADRDMTAYELAKKAGLTPSAVYKLLKKGDDMRHIDVSTLEKLARALGVKDPLTLLEYRK